MLDSGVDICYLTSRGRYRGRIVPAESKNVLQNYERRMEDVFKESGTGENTSYRSLLRRQAYRLAKTIQMGEPYQPYIEEV